MSVMYCFYCDRPIDTDYFQKGHQFFPDFKCEDCVEKESETCDLSSSEDDRNGVVATIAKEQ